MVLRKILGTKWDDVAGEWRGAYYLYCSPNIIWGDQIKRNKMDEACSTYGEKCVQGRERDNL
jgi:hypothetical protein